MKKIMSFIFGMLILVGFAATSFAEVVQGSIVSLNTAKNEIVVKDSATGSDKTIMVHPKVMATLQSGTVVKATIKPGSNTADTVEVNIG
jgi:hypothetical protein